MALAKQNVPLELRLSTPPDPGAAVHGPEEENRPSHSVTSVCDLDHIGQGQPGLSYRSLQLKVTSNKFPEGRAVTKIAKASSNGHHWLRIHKRHLGLYARVADELGVSPSYVSLVANGMRQSEKIRRALVTEIARIHASVH